MADANNIGWAMLVAPLAGAAARLLGINLDSVIEAFGDFGFGGGNIEAAREAYEGIQIQQHEPEPGEIHKPPRPPAWRRRTACAPWPPSTASSGAWN